jgi:hypothetical protein
MTALTRGPMGNMTDLGSSGRTLSAKRACRDFSLIIGRQPAAFPPQKHAEVPAGWNGCYAPWPTFSRAGSRSCPPNLDRRSGQATRPTRRRGLWEVALSVADRSKSQEIAMTNSLARHTRKDSDALAGSGGSRVARG